MKEPAGMDRQQFKQAACSGELSQAEASGESVLCLSVPDGHTLAVR